MSHKGPAPDVDQPKAIIGPIDDRSLVPKISMGKVILACAPHENPAMVQNNNKYFQLPSRGDKTMPANEAANVITLRRDFKLILRYVIGPRSLRR